MNKAAPLFKRLAGLMLKRPGLVIALWGEPGIGKTHLVQRLLRETPCQHLSLHASVSITGFARALPKPSGLSASTERTLERSGQGEHVDATSLIDALAAVLGKLAPFILHLEDLHEASPEQRGFVIALARVVLRLKGVGLIVTSREQPPEGFEAFRLGPLSGQRVHEMLNAEVSADLPNEALDWIHARAAGNPLFTLEYFRFLARRGFLWNDGHRWRWRTPERESLPVTVEALIGAVIAKAAANTLLEGAIFAKATLGRDVSPALWAEVAGLTPQALRGAMLELEREGLLNAQEFAHPLYSEVVALAFKPEQRRLLARRTLVALEADPLAAAAFIEGADLEPEMALVWFERAMQAARALGNNVRAARFQARAVHFAGGDAQARLALEAAKILSQIDFPEASRLAQVAALQPSYRMEAILLEADLLAAQGNLAEAERLLGHLPDLGSDLLKRCKRFVLRATAQEFASALELWRADEALRASDDLSVLVAAVQTLAGLRYLPEAQAVIDRALALPDLSATDRNALEGRQVSIFLLTKQLEPAIALLAELMPKLSDETEPRVKAGALHNRANTLERLGQHRAAVLDFLKAAELYARVGDARMQARARVAAAWQLWHGADYEEAETVLLESRETLLRSDAFDTLVECDGILSLMYLDWGAPFSLELANRHASAALETARALQNPYEIVASLSDLSIVRVRQGRSDEALKLSDEMGNLCEAHGLGGMQANVLYARALAFEAKGQHDQALRLMLEAEMLNKQVGGEIFTRKIGIEIARLSNDLECAHEHLAWFESRGMRNNTLMILRSFPELNAATQAVALPEANTRLRLEVFGPMRLVRDGLELPVRGQKRLELLALLLEARIAGRREVSRLDLIDALYPDGNETQASTALKNIVHQVRELCSANTIQTTEGGYALGAITSDAEEFLETGDTRLWRGAYLEGLSLDRSSETVRETLHLALQNRAEILLETDPLEATRIGRLLGNADPYDLEHLRLMLRALRAAGNHKSLNRTYERARERSLEVGQVLPETWAGFLDLPQSKRIVLNAREISRK